MTNKNLKIFPTSSGHNNFSFFNFNFSFPDGFGVIEIIVVVAMIITALFGFLQTEIVALRLLHTEQENLEASVLAEEGLEAVRSVRDESWTNNITPLANDTLYYPVIQNGKWKLDASAHGNTNNKYVRTITFKKVYRDSNDDIASSGTEDTKTRKIISKITWGTKTVQLSTYITDFQSSLSPPTEAKVIFYEDAPTDANLANFPSNNAGDGDPAQGFTTSASPQYKVTKVELYLRNATTSPSPIFIDLRRNATSSVVGTSQTIDSSTIASSTYTWIEFRFLPAITLATSTKYYIRLQSTPPSVDSGSSSAGYVYWGYKQYQQEHSLFGLILAGLGIN